jgi:hypothetical protein
MTPGSMAAAIERKQVARANDTSSMGAKDPIEELSALDATVASIENLSSQYCPESSVVSPGRTNKELVLQQRTTFEAISQRNKSDDSSSKSSRMHQEKPVVVEAAASNDNKAILSGPPRHFIDMAGNTENCQVGYPY